MAERCAKGRPSEPPLRLLDPTAIGNRLSDRQVFEHLSDRDHEPAAVRRGDTRTCDRLWYNTDVGSRVRVTRNPDENGHRNWTVQSLPPHEAGCYVKVGRTLQWDGIARVIPFSMKIAELGS